MKGHLMQQYPQSATTAHGAPYWILVGWWWGPTKLLGRMLLWLFLWPVGLWRSIRHHQDTREGKTTRGVAQANQAAQEEAWREGKMWPPPQRAKGPPPKERPGSD